MYISECMYVYEKVKTAVIWTVVKTAVIWKTHYKNDERIFKSKKKTNSYERLLSFRHDEVPVRILVGTIERLPFQFYQQSIIQSIQKDGDTSQEWAIAATKGYWPFVIQNNIK